MLNLFDRKFLLKNFNWQFVSKEFYRQFFIEYLFPTLIEIIFDNFLLNIESKIFLCESLKNDFSAVCFFQIYWKKKMYFSKIVLLLYISSLENVVENLWFRPKFRFIRKI